jgi:hypothetical protein
MIVGVDGLLVANRRQIVELAAKHRLPAIYPSRDLLHRGTRASRATACILAKSKSRVCEQAHTEV